MLLCAFLLSLPLWECGLKSRVYSDDNIAQLSLPLWECGLKSYEYPISLKVIMSLPLWECGLKYRCLHCDLLEIFVTPLVGVWIEICQLLESFFVRGCHSPCGSVD